MKIKRLLCLTLALTLFFVTAGCHKGGGGVSSITSTTSSKAASSAPWRPTSSVASSRPSSSQAETVSSQQSAQPSAPPEGGVSHTSPSKAPTPSAAPPPASSEPKKEIVTVTLQEGMTLVEIAKKLEANDVCSAQGFIDASQNYAFDLNDYPLVAAIAQSGHRCYRLEGYLFPDTYQFYTNSLPQDAIGRFLRNTEAKLSGYQSRAAELGYSMDEIITIASLIEGEAGNPDELATVSGILYNRLNQGWYLKFDAATDYLNESVIPYYGDGYNGYYNTYKCPALPAGPICNPGLLWIEAALYPASTDYMYFLNDHNGNYYYAVTDDEHEENRKKAGFV